jgi:hypothetical protein
VTTYQYCNLTFNPGRLVLPLSSLSLTVLKAANQLRPPLCLELTRPILKVAPELIADVLLVEELGNNPFVSHCGCSATVDIEGTAISNDLDTKREVRHGQARTVEYWEASAVAWDD